LKPVIRRPSAAEAALAAQWPVWSCEASSFEWGYAEDETCLILEGEAVVEALGKEWPFAAGDWVVFPKGLACRWRVIKAMKKHYRNGPFPQ
jgi:uncharacterized cupin superfamily protein